MRCFSPLNLSDLHYKMIGSTKITVFKNVALFLCARNLVRRFQRKKSQLLMLWSESNELPPALVTTREGEWGFLQSLLDNLDKGTDAHSCRSFLTYVTISVTNKAFALKSDLLLMWESQGFIPLLWMQWLQYILPFQFNSKMHFLERFMWYMLN